MTKGKRKREVAARDELGKRIEAGRGAGHGEEGQERGSSRKASWARIMAVNRRVSNAWFPARG